ncbi:unnamed protein product [Symbiodinium natans]|uniref:Glycine-rich domain-containing protein n=1 Tax=Symbiodinium natans TaxID=878477 RepID=A0A812U4L2_9DINO|nr:unnamed protein product [Symbiodinium natans]
MSVDLWGGGGGGTGSAVKEQEEAGIIEVTVNFRPSSFGSASRIYHPNGLYFRDEDSAGNVRYVRSDDVYHLSRQEDCRVSPQKAAFPCWKLALNSEYFHVTPLAMLEWPSDELPLGDRTWVMMDTPAGQPFAQPFQDVTNISLKSARKSCGICGGSGGAGAHVRALVKVKAGRTYRIEAGQGGKGSSGGRSASNGQSSRMLEMQASGEWSILAEAGGGFGAGSMEGRLKFSPGGRGGTAPKLDSHVFARPGHPGWSSRASLLTEDTILFPMAMLPALRSSGRPGTTYYAARRDVPPKGQLPQRLFPPGVSVTCTQETEDNDYAKYPFRKAKYPPLCSATNARYPAEFGEFFDFFLTCDVNCEGTRWPVVPTAGQGSVGVGLTAQTRSGWGGTGSCPQIQPGSKVELRSMGGEDGHNGSVILRRCKREGAYTLALQRCQGSDTWTVHGLWPRGVRNCKVTKIWSHPPCPP